MYKITIKKKLKRNKEISNKKQTKTQFETFRLLLIVGQPINASDIIMKQ
jgi:hypothetical protein